MSGLGRKFELDQKIGLISRDPIKHKMIVTYPLNTSSLNTSSMKTAKISLNETVTRYLLQFCFHKYSAQMFNAEKLFLSNFNKYLQEMGQKLNSDEEKLLSPWTLFIEPNFVRDKFQRGIDRSNQSIDKINKQMRNFFENELPGFVTTNSFSEKGFQLEGYHRRSFFGLVEQPWNLNPEDLKIRLIQLGMSAPWIEGVDLETFPVIAYTKGNQRINPRKLEEDKRFSTQCKKMEIEEAFVQKKRGDEVEENEVDKVIPSAKISPEEEDEQKKAFEMAYQEAIREAIQLIVEAGGEEWEVDFIEIRDNVKKMFGFM